VLLVIELLDDFDLTLADEEHVATVGTFFEDVAAFFVFMDEHILFNDAVVILFKEIEYFQFWEQGVNGLTHGLSIPGY
jgi:hypothetical protein